jgi:hypothetical protein
MDAERKCVACGRRGFVSHGALCAECRLLLCPPRSRPAEALEEAGRWVADGLRRLAAWF